MIIVILAENKKKKTTLNDRNSVYFSHKISLERVSFLQSRMQTLTLSLLSFCSHACCVMLQDG